jgi:hypothetical protein
MLGRRHSSAKAKPGGAWSVQAAHASHSRVARYHTVALLAEQQLRVQDTHCKTAIHQHTRVLPAAAPALCPLATGTRELSHTAGRIHVCVGARMCGAAAAAMALRMRPRTHVLTLVMQSTHATLVPLRPKKPKHGGNQPGRASRRKRQTTPCAYTACQPTRAEGSPGGPQHQPTQTNRQ